MILKMVEFRLQRSMSCITSIYMTKNKQIYRIILGKKKSLELCSQTNWGEDLQARII